MMGIPKDDGIKKRRKIRITFNEEEDVINPEDIDPSIGRFRNMVETTIIPNKPRYVFLGLRTKIQLSDHGSRIRIKTHKTDPDLNGTSEKPQNTGTGKTLDTKYETHYRAKKNVNNPKLNKFLVKGKTPQRGGGGSVSHALTG